jgi:hypothetical protein
MTNAAKTSGTATAAAAPAKVWPQRNIQFKTTPKGEYAIITDACSKFNLVALVVGAALVAELKAA